jgi:NAD(P) transhydrogenase subunit alpha
MSKEFIEAEMKLFLEQAAEVDIIITTAQIPGRPAPKLILDYHVAAMKPGSVIVDLAASTGGNCVLTKNGEVHTTENGVVIVGKLNLLPNQASQLYGNNLCHLLDDMGKAEKFNINMDDAIVSRAMVTHNGNINWPPAPLPVSATPKPAEKPVLEDPRITEEKNARKQATSMIIRLLIIGAFLGLIGQFAPADFVQHFTVFVLSVFVGWQVIWNVSHSLHTPLMAVTNAISGIIVVGGLIQIGNLDNPMSNLPITVLATIAILVASINIVGGFVVTHRMLKMFKK